MASEKVTALLEEIKAMTVLELSELVHAVEEEFGVSAAAAVAVAAPADGGAAAAEEKTCTLPPSGRVFFCGLFSLLSQSPILRHTYTKKPRIAVPKRTAIRGFELHHTELLQIISWR